MNIQSIICRFSLKYQIGIIVFVAAVIFLMVGLVYSLGSYRQNSADNRAEIAAQAKDAAEAVQFFLLDARRLERDFLYGRGGDAEDSLIQHHEDVKAARDRMHVLTSALDAGADLPLVQKVEDDIDAYQGQFAKVADLRKAVGLTENDGLLGTLRNSVHDVEAVLGQNGDRDLMVMMLMLRRHEKDFLARLDPKYIVEFDKQADAFSASLKAGPLNDADKARIEDGMARYRKAFHSAADAVGAIGKETGVLEDRYNRLSPDLQSLRNLSARAFDAAHSERKSIAELSGRVIAFALVAGTILMVGIGGVIARAIYLPLVHITGVMDAVAHGDMSGEIPERARRDEVGLMIQALRVFKDNAITAETLRKEQEAANRSKMTRSAALERLMGDFESSSTILVKNVYDASSDLRTTANGMGRLMEETEGCVNTVEKSSTLAAENVSTVAAATQQLSASINEITRLVKRSNEVAHAAASEAARSNEIIQGLADAAGQIGDVVQMITDIAGQTNLLALNATIEAARAGEAGKGFAVVAGEVKNLSTATAKATGDITEKVKAIQMESVSARTAIEDIVQTIKAMTEMSEAVAVAVGEQDAATQEIARSVQNAAGSTADVSSSVETLLNIANETAHSTKVLVVSANIMSGLSNEMEDKIKVLSENLRDI